MSSTDVKKRLSLKEIEELVGEKTVSRLVTAMLRRKAKKVVSIRTDELKRCEEMLASGQLVKGGLFALGKLTWKRAHETPVFKGSMVKYANALRKAFDDANKVSGKRGRPKKV